MENKIKAVLFDSGRVLNRPVTGHWFITPNFFKFVDKNKFDKIKSSRVDYAFSKSLAYVNSHEIIKNENEEYECFFEFYDTLSSCLPELELTYKDVVKITEDYVYNYDKYIFYDDAGKVINDLKHKYKLGVVSDAWPSLENVFRKAGLRDQFSSFVISSQIGTTKPDKKMYEKALEDLCIKPDEAVFIDDNINNCEGAEKIGINSFVLSRSFTNYLYLKYIKRKNNVIKNLYELENII